MHNVFRVFENSFWANGSINDTHFHHPVRIQFSEFLECNRVVLGCSADFLGAAENGHKADFRRIIFDVEKEFKYRPAFSKGNFREEKCYNNNLGDGAGGHGRWGNPIFPTCILNSWLPGAGVPHMLCTRIAGLTLGIYASTITQLFWASYNIPLLSLTRTGTQSTFILIINSPNYRSHYYEAL